jgi:DNA (cytosine-5)-methyltransferase 1
MRVVNEGTKVGMNELALFAGAGGGILGGHLLGWRTVCAVELDAYARSVLLARQRDGLLPRFPVWNDVRTFDGKPWRGRVQVVSGGFPCTDISTANANKRGLDGEASGLWREMARIICEVEPDFAFVENVPSITVRGLDRVLWDLASMGLHAAWCVLSSEDVGIPMRRERFWLVAARDERRLGWARLSRQAGRQPLAGIAGADLPIPRPTDPVPADWTDRALGVRGTDGMARRVDRIRAIGNGQTPRLAAAAFTMLSPPEHA